MLKRLGRRPGRDIDGDDTALSERKRIIKHYARQTPETILALPLDTLMAMPVEILQALPLEKFALLPPEVLERLSPPVLSKLPPENLALLSPPTLIAVLNHKPGIHSHLPEEALAKLWRPNRLRERLPLLDSDQDTAPTELEEVCLPAENPAPAAPALIQTATPTIDPDSQFAKPQQDALLRGPRLKRDVARLENESQRVGETIHKFLEGRIKWAQWKPDDDPVNQILECTLYYVSVADKNYESAEYWIKQHQEEKDKRTTLESNLAAMREEEKEGRHKEKSQQIALDTTVQDLAAKLEEQKQVHQKDMDQQATLESTIVNLTAMLEEEKKGHQKEWSQRKTLEATVQDLTAKLDEQKQSVSQATQDLSDYEAEVKRLEQIIDTQGKELARYQRTTKSEEERHTATVQRLIGEHVAEVGDLMTSYEKELVETRMAHDTERTWRDKRYLKDVKRLQDEIMALESKLGIDSDLEEDLGQPVADGEPEQCPDNPDSSPTPSSGPSPPKPRIKTPTKSLPRPLLPSQN
jgi:hypothetical protein